MEKEEYKNKTPHRMSRIAFPKSKYGVYLAIFIVFLVLIILYKDSMTQIAKTHLLIQQDFRVQHYRSSSPEQLMELHTPLKSSLMTKR